MAHAPLGYLLHLADNALVLGQRIAEWCGHGPILEEDLALTNISLDLIGQARLLYQHAATVINDPQARPEVDAVAAPLGLRAGDATEDSLAYLRDPHHFRNYLLLELPNHGPLAATAASNRDYATTIVRNWLYSEFMVPVWQALQGSADEQLAAIAGKSLKETRYHLRHATDWLVRLGDGTDESNKRMQNALDHLMPYTREFWTVSPAEAAAVANGTGVDTALLKTDWDREVDAALAEATLQRSSMQGSLPRGKEGLHSEHLSFLLAEMQGLARQHPGGVW